MRKLFAIGTLLLSSAAVMVSPAAASDRNNYVNNQNYNHGYSAPAPVFDRDAQVRIDQRVREQRFERERNERERNERARHDVRYVRSLRDGC